MSYLADALKIGKLQKADQHGASGAAVQNAVELRKKKELSGSINRGLMFSPIFLI